MLDFTGRTIVITGAAGGMGSAMVELMNELGASVVACDRDEAGLAGLWVDRSVAFDLADDAAVARAAAEILDGGPVPHAIISNAGVTNAETLRDVDDAAFAAEIAQNRDRRRDVLAGVPAGDARDRRRRVRVRVVGQRAGAFRQSGIRRGEGGAGRLDARDRHRGGQGRHPRERGGAGLGADRRMGRADRGGSGDPRRHQGATPLGRLVTPREVAMAAAFLASPLAGGITGVTLNVDAGLMAGNLPFLRRIMEV